MAKVSIIVPCYNVEPYIKCCLNCLINQTLQDIEIICIDDKSEDKTLNLIKKYAKKDERIKLICHRKNMGVATSRNDGLKYATGEYIGFVDPDDYVDLNFYEQLYTTAIQNNVDIAKGNLHTVNLNAENSYDDKKIKKIQKNVIYFYVSFSSAIYKRSFLKKHAIKFPKDLNLGEDSVFLSSIVSKSPTISVYPSVCYHYIRRVNSLDSQKLTHDKVLSVIKMLDYKLDILKGTKFQTVRDYRLFVKKHILVNLFYNMLDKECANAADKKLFFNWLVKSKLPRSLLSQRLRLYQIKALKRKNYKDFNKRPILLFNKENLANNKINIHIFGIKIFSYNKTTNF